MWYGSTMKTTDFIVCLDRQEIPPEPPRCQRWRDIYDRSTSPPTDWREECTKRGMWALVYRSWVRELAAWISGRLVLEVMAGRGWLARALAEEGVSIIATDDNSWDDRHSKSGPVFTVAKEDALQAIVDIDADVLIMSWPPYGDEVATEALATWGEGRPVVYIGEERGGCNAPDSFWQHWREDKSAPEVPLAQWDGLHDVVCIGHYVSEPHHVCPKCGGWIYDDDDWCSGCARSDDTD